MSGACLLEASSDTTVSRAVDLRIPVLSKPIQYLHYKSLEVRQAHCKGAVGVLQGLRFISKPDGGYEGPIEMSNDTGGCAEMIMPTIPILQTAQLAMPPPILPSFVPGVSEECKKRSLSNTGHQNNKKARVSSSEDTGLLGIKCNGTSFGRTEASTVGSVCSVEGDASDDGSTENQGGGRLTGRWTREEHEAFLEGLKMHGREWKKVAQKITSRTSAQIRSHAQKYFTKLAKEGQDNVVVSNLPYHSASVIEKIELIMKNPVAVEKEVNSTLQMLTERYNVLRKKIEEKQAPRSDGNIGSSPALADLSSAGESKTSLVEVAQKSLLSESAMFPAIASIGSPSPTKYDKKSFENGGSIVSSTLIKYNITRKPSPTPRDYSSALNKGEHIALEVPGADFPK